MFGFARELDNGDDQDWEAKTKEEERAAELARIRRVKKVGSS